MKSPISNLDFKISPSTSFIELHLYESAEGHKPFLQFLAWYDDGTYSMMNFEFEGLCATKTNNVWDDFVSGEIGVIDNSAWLNEYAKTYVKCFPLSEKKDLNDIKHYYFIGHDLCVEILATGFTQKKITSDHV